MSYLDRQDDEQPGAPRVETVADAVQLVVLGCIAFLLFVESLLS